jgi:hypothetical protein
MPKKVLALARARARNPPGLPEDLRLVALGVILLRKVFIRLLAGLVKELKNRLSFFRIPLRGFTRPSIKPNLRANFQSLRSADGGPFRAPWLSAGKPLLSVSLRKLRFF